MFPKKTLRLFSVKSWSDLSLSDRSVSKQEPVITMIIDAVTNGSKA